MRTPFRVRFLCESWTLSCAGISKVPAEEYCPEPYKEAWQATWWLGGRLLLPALAPRLGARHQVWLTAAVPDYQGKRSLLDEIRDDPRLEVVEAIHGLGSRSREPVAAPVRRSL